MILNATKEDFENPQVAQYFVDSKDLKGAIIPSANFEPLPIAISAQRAAVALAHVAHNCVQRTLRMDEDRFSGLPRYLTAESNKNGHNFGATEDSMVSIYAENIDLANPVSFDGSAVEGNIEDTASNLPRIAERLNRSASNIIDLYSMELLHSTQAVDLRKARQSNVKLSDKTEALYKAYRAKVPFVDKDRIFSQNLADGIELLKQW
ncbi:MAG: aromatic amino acid lyase [Sutterella sp.]